MTGASKITLFGLCYPSFMRKTDPKKSSYVACKWVNDTSPFKRRDTEETFNILKGPLDCNFNHIYLFGYKQCQYAFLM